MGLFFARRQLAIEHPNQSLFLSSFLRAAFLRCIYLSGRLYLSPLIPVRKIVPAQADIPQLRVIERHQRPTGAAKRTPMFVAAI